MPLGTDAQAEFEGCHVLLTEEELVGHCVRCPPLALKSCASCAFCQQDQWAAAAF